MNHWYRTYTQILEDNTQYRSLSDAGEYYQPGNTQVWYQKKDTQTNRVNLNDLSSTHSMVGTLKETDPEAVLSMMQSESWNTDNNAESMLNKLGVSHSSMTTGDVVVVDKIAHVITTDGIESKEFAS